MVRPRPALLALFAAAAIGSTLFHAGTSSANLPPSHDPAGKASELSAVHEVVLRQRTIESLLRTNRDLAHKPQPPQVAGGGEPITTTPAVPAPSRGHRSGHNDGTTLSAVPAFSPTRPRAPPPPSDLPHRVPPPPRDLPRRAPPPTSDPPHKPPPSPSTNATTTTPPPELKPTPPTWRHVGLSKQQQQSLARRARTQEVQFSHLTKFDKCNSPIE